MSIVESVAEIATEGFLQGGGEMGALMRRHDWSASSLGAPSGWPQSLRTAVRLVLNSGHPMYIWWGSDLACLYNDSYRATLGPERHPSSLGRPGRTVWEDIWPIIGPQVDQVMSGGGSTWQENHLVPITRNGKREDVYWTYSYSPIDDAAAPGGIGGVLVVCSETTGMVQVQRQLQNERDQFSQLFEQAPTFMAMLSGPDHRFDLANPAYMRLIGHRAVLGKTVAEALPDAVEQGYLGLLDGVFTTGEAFAAHGAKYSVQPLPGGSVTERYVDFVYQPVRNADGQVVGIFVEGADVTERRLGEVALRESEERLRRLNADLERQVIERSDALRQAQKMEAVGQLTGGLAHDFNNLLAGISGCLELLQKRVSQGRMEEGAKYIAAANGSVQRAAALTQRLLAFSRRQTLDPRPTDVNKLVDGMEDLIRRTVGPTIEIEISAAGDLWATKIDSPQLESTLLNLCLNARDAIAPDGGRLTIETANEWLDERAARERDLPPGPYISLSVTDTGAGMDQDTIARAFDPFFTTKPLGEGTGLGLSMVYGFVRQSGGQVRIQSELGRGTTMRLYLPRHAGAADAGAEEDLPSAVDRGHGETVLVVDDEMTIRMLIGEVLAENGYRSLEAADGPSALRILQTDVPIDLLITDVGLPGGLNGRQVADAARLLRPELKVLFITGYAETAVIAHDQLAAGMQVITKPFALSSLATRIRDLLAGGRV